MRFTLICLLLSFLQYGYSQESIALNTAIRNGNAKELSKSFSKKIDLSINGIDGIYSSQQAELILSNFFKENPPSSFEVKHKGGVKNSSRYEIGEYVSSTKKYRTHMLFQLVEKTPQIIELRFELED